MLFRVQDLCVTYGENKILNDVTFDVQEGEIVMLAGANGAGKSTLLKALIGLIPYQKGKIYLSGELITPRAHHMAQQGVFYVPQEDRVFPEMTVAENIQIGGFSLQHKSAQAERYAEVCKLFPQLEAKITLPAANLSGGERQMLALARGLMTRPRLLFLDEPSVGLAPKLVQEVFAQIQEINRRSQVAMIIVEHNLKSLLSIAHRVLVLANGKIVLSGDSKSVLNAKILESVFFGKLA